MAPHASMPLAAWGLNFPVVSRQPVLRKPASPGGFFIGVPVKFPYIMFVIIIIL